MDPALVARGRLVVDSIEAAVVESGDIVSGLAEGRFGRDHLSGELGSVAAGSIRGRTRLDEVTIFKSLGLAVEDVAAGALAARRAEAIELRAIAFEIEGKWNEAMEEWDALALAGGALGVFFIGFVQDPKTAGAGVASFRRSRLGC